MKIPREKERKKELIQEIVSQLKDIPHLCDVLQSTIVLVDTEEFKACERHISVVDYLLHLQFDTNIIKYKLKDEIKYIESQAGLKSVDTFYSDRLT